MKMNTGKSRVAVLKNLSCREDRPRKGPGGQAAGDNAVVAAKCVMNFKHGALLRNDATGLMLVQHDAYRVHL